MRKCWTKTRLKNNRSGFKFCISVSDVHAFFKSPTPFSFIDCIHFSLFGCFYMPRSLAGISLLWYLQHFGISHENQASPSELLYSGLSGLPCSDTSVTCLASELSLAVRKNPKPHSCNLDLKLHL